MKLIIDIDDKVYNDLKNRGLTGMLTGKECECMNEAIYNGTPLEEEIEKIKDEIEEEDSDCQYEEDYVYNGGLQKAIEIIDRHIFKLKGE